MDLCIVERVLIVYNDQYKRNAGLKEEGAYGKFGRNPEKQTNTYTKNTVEKNQGAQGSLFSYFTLFNMALYILLLAYVRRNFGI